MSLEKRLQRIEGLRQQKVPDGKAREKLRELLDRIANRLLVTGDVEHQPADSKANNLARAFARGDKEAATSIVLEIKEAMR